MQIPPEKIEEILERTDLVALISRYVELKPSGRTFKGLCPFHGEKTPSFHVNPERRSFKCFGCDVGGDAISFLKRLNGHTFVEVVRELAREAGVNLEEREDPAARERAQLREVTELARRHFEDRLWNDPRALPGRNHLAERGVREDTARQFGLGYALNSWNDLTTRLVREGVLEWAKAAGLSAPSKKVDGFYDTFRGRLMIPIRSPEGRTVAFGARLVEESNRPGSDPGPKYLNSRESPIYRKSDLLYALDLAKEEVRKQKAAVLVEGYFDVIGLYSAGVRNAVALCSTALTSGHLAALARADAQELVLLLDGDAAGVKAVERLAGPILAAGARARVASLPGGDDPDTFAMREGKAAVDALVAGAPPLSSWLLDRVLPRGRSAGFEEKLAALARLKPVLEQVPAGMARTLLINELAEHFGVPESDVRGHLVGEAARPAAPRPKAPAPAPAPAPAKPKVPEKPLDPAEEFFAALLVADPTLRLAPEARFTDELRSVELRLALESEKPEEALPGLRPGLKAGIERHLAEIRRTLGGESQSDARRKALGEASSKMRLARLEERLAEKQAEVRQAQAAGASDDDVFALLTEIKELSQLRMRLRARSSGNGAAAPSSKGHDA